MSKITLTIDDKKITVDSGLTVLKAAEAAGVYIPTLCYHSYLTPYGGCRMCIVEIEAMRGIPTACTTPATDGMVVHTSTLQLQELRKGFLELMLAKHPSTCLTCDRNGECDPYRTSMRKVGVTTGCKFCPNNGNCELQKVVEYVGLTEVRLPNKYRQLTPDRRDPFFERDYNLCILCGRCVRVCQEVRGIGAIAFTYRSRQALVGTAFGESLQEAGCRFCGACIDICPTGALSDRRRKWEGLPEKTVVTTCPYCGVGCQLELEVRDGRVIGVVPSADGLNKGQACVRGRFGITGIANHLKRLKTPMVKRDGELVEASWDEALDLAAERLGKYKGDEIAVICCAETTNEENYLLQKLARNVLGTNNIDHAARLGRSSLPPKGAMLDFISGVADAGCILAIGTDPTVSQPVIGVEIKRALDGGGKLVVASPYRSGLCRLADIWLQYRPGTDLVLLGGIMKVIIDEKLEDRVSIAESGDGFDSLKKSLKSIDLKNVVDVTGVPAEQIIEAARLYAAARPGCILYGEGITWQSHGDRSLSALNNLALLTGNTGKPSAGVNPVTGSNNVRGACDMGVIPDYLPGYQAVEKPGMSFDGMLAAIEKGQIKAAYIIGDDPELHGKLDKLEFLLVQSMFPSSVTSAADIVLPSASLVEKDGTFTNMEGRIQQVHKAIEPVAGSMPDWWIICRIARRLKGKGFGFRGAKGITTEIKKHVSVYGSSGEKPGFTELSYEVQVGVTDSDYPLVLITVPSLYYFNAAAMDVGLGEFSTLEGGPQVTVSPEDAVGMKISDGEEARLVSRWGELPVTVKVENTLPGGVVSIPLHFVRSILNPVADPDTGLREYRGCAVKLEK